MFNCEYTKNPEHCGEFCVCKLWALAKQQFYCHILYIHLLITCVIRATPTKHIAQINLVTAYIAICGENIDTVLTTPPTIKQPIREGLLPSLSDRAPTVNAPTAAPAVKQIFTTVSTPVFEHTNPNYKRESKYLRNFLTCDFNLQEIFF